MKVLLSIFLLFSLMACSGSKTTNEAGDDQSTELAENDEFSEDFSEDVDGAMDEDEDELAEGDEDEAMGDEEESDEVAEDETMDQVEETDTVSEEVAEVEPTPVPAAATDMAGGEAWYTVKANDTLMIVAFKIYGDYGKWRQLARWNSNQLGSGYSLSTGMKLKYMAPSQKFVWNPSGNPYLIRKGDTLGTISNDTYGTMKYWRNIWNNNRPLIKDPNRIFAGFTIYTPNIDRGVANSDM